MYENYFYGYYFLRNYDRNMKIWLIYSIGLSMVFIVKLDVAKLGRSKTMLEC